MFTDGSLYPNLFLFLFFSVNFQYPMAVSPIVSPIISHHLRSLYFSFFLQKRLWGRAGKEEGVYGSNALKTGDFLHMYPLLFCLFSVYFMFKKGVLGVLLYRGKGGEKKGKEGDC